MTKEDSYVFNAWLPLLAYPNAQAPDFKSGYKVNAGLWGVYLCGIPFIWWFSKRYPPAKMEQPYSEEGQYLEEENNIQNKALAEGSLVKEMKV